MPSEKLLFVEARRTVPVVAGSKSALTRIKSFPSKEKGTSMASLVVPGMGETITLSSLSKAQISIQGLGLCGGYLD